MRLTQGGILEIPLDPAGVEEPAEDLWILGGMFLERFVVSFDFDEGRMGVAEPASSTEGLDTIGMANLRGVPASEHVTPGRVKNRLHASLYLYTFNVSTEYSWDGCGLV